MSTEPQTTSPEQSTPVALAPSADGSFRYRVERRKGSLVTIEVEADAARLSAAVERVFGRRNRQANIPGFRPGKAPRAIYERAYGAQHLWSEGAEDLIESIRYVTRLRANDPALP